MNQIPQKAGIKKVAAGIVLAIMLLLGYQIDLPAFLDDVATVEYEQVTFRNEKLKKEHYEKHGREMGFSSADEYEKAAAAVVANQDSLHKIEAEDGDDVYYLESTNEFVIVSTDGYIRTYYMPRDGKDYFERQ